MTYLLTMAYLFSPRPSIQRRPGMDQVGTNENSKGHLLIDGFQLHHQETIRCWECVCVCKNHCRMLECRSTRNRKNQIFKSCEVRLWSAILFFSHKSSTWNRSSPQSQRCWRSWANTPEGLVKMSMKGRDKPLGIHVLKLGKTKTPQKKWTWKPKINGPTMPCEEELSSKSSFSWRSLLSSRAASNHKLALWYLRLGRPPVEKWISSSPVHYGAP